MVNKQWSLGYSKVKKKSALIDHHFFLRSGVDNSWWYGEKKKNGSLSIHFLYSLWDKAILFRSYTILERSQRSFANGHTLFWWCLGLKASTDYQLSHQDSFDAAPLFICHHRLRQLRFRCIPIRHWYWPLSHGHDIAYNASIIHQ